MDTRAGRPAGRAPDRRGTNIVADRYVLLRELGAGGVGTVYLAEDRQTGETLALKTLARVDAKSVLRFKREFRSVAHVQHPNLVRLYDLEREPDGMWFLTMEYVPGTDLVSHLRPPGAAPPDWASESARVLDTFRQLARGVSALHAASMLHRDLKPSNVLVSSGRVSILDFGLVRGIGEQGAQVTEEGTMAGTPAYMAPEQALAQPLQEAADWYAVGVMLYESLSGELPFEGTVAQILRGKIEAEPLPLVELEPDAPRVLIDLCMDLLQREPSQRPSGAEILARFGEVPTSTWTDIHTQQTENDNASVPAFVGRTEQLEQLWRALDDVEQDQAVAVHVFGVSGAGKSAVLEQFLTQVESRNLGARTGDVLVLRSRCYEREAMPFKALDSIIDALVLDLAKRDDLAASRLLPADIQALVQLFPVLERVRAVKKLLGTRRQQNHARSHRKRAEAALRELFGRLAETQRLIVWVDDLQWGDLDSIAILRGWLEQDSSVPLLLLLSYRSDELDTSAALRALRAPREPGTRGVAEHRIEIGPLASDEIRELCNARLGARAQGRDALIEKMVEEASGSPFLASQLTSLAQAKLARGDSSFEALSIADLMTQMRELLPAEGSQVLAVLAVAGRPMLPTLALRVAGVQRGGRAIMHALRNLSLVRTRDAGGERLAEIYHDRIREHVYAELSEPALRALHNELLRDLECSGHAAPDWLHSLALGAGDDALALQHGCSAAAQAHAALAFERATELYQSCLTLCADDIEQRCVLWRKLGLVLGHSGRGVRAAQALLEAAQLSDNANEVLELKRMAASHLVRSGRFEQGAALFDEIMTASSIHPPSTEGTLIAAVVWERCRLELRGLSFRQKAVEQVSPAVLERIDLLEDLRIATINLDPLRSVWFATQSLRLALDAGEPSRVVRAFATAATLAAVGGSPRSAARSRDMLVRADAIANELGRTRERMELDVVRAVVALYEGRAVDVPEPAIRAEHALRELASDAADANTYFFKFSARSVLLGALSQLDWRRFREAFQEIRQEAQATENVQATLMLALNEFFWDELSGQPEIAVTRLEAQRALLPARGFSVLHVIHMTAATYAACATGQHAWGFECLARYWPAFMRSPMRRTRSLRAITHMGRARLLLNEYVRSRTGEAALKQASKDAAVLLSGHPHRIRGRVALLRGDRAGALAELTKSAEVFEADGIEPEAQRTRYAIGQLIGGETGERGTRAARSILEQRFGCHDACRDARVYFPELAGPV